MNKQLAVYPDLTDPNFYNLIANKKEFFDNRRAAKNKYFLTNYQRIVSNFINPVSPYNSLLVYASVGIGKSLLAITIAENFKKNYKILVVLKNETLIDSFKNELKLFDKDPKKYNFITYNELVSQVIGHKVIHVGLSTKIEYQHKKNGVGRTNLNNTLVIIDEVHNITEIKLQPILLDLLKASYDTKLLLLTATPMYDNITEIFELANLLNAKDPEYQLPTKQKDLINAGFIKSSINNKKILNDTSNKITELGKQILTKTLKGKISYFQIEESVDYAKKNFIGANINSGNGNIKINKSVMSNFQENIYIKTLNSKDNTLFRNSIDASTIVFPDSTFGSEGFKKNKLKLSFMKKETIEKYSCKFYSLINAIDISKGNIFIFTNFVNNRGIDLIQVLLQKNGYNKYNPKINVADGSSFVILKGCIDSSVLQSRITTFNSPENKNGKLIKILIGSPIISEGITLKNIRQIHILDPPWNMSKIDQIIGRGIRYKSHQDLPISDRNVDIYLHASIIKGNVSNKISKSNVSSKSSKSNTSSKSNVSNTSSKSNGNSISIDYLKYKLAYSKDKAIKEIEYLLRKISIDCILNKNLSSKLDYSRECLYEKCNYTCQDILPNKVMNSIKGKDIDKSTFLLNAHAKEEYNFIYNKIIQLFNIGFVYNTEYIINYIKQGTEILNENIFLVLYEMVKNNVLFNNKKGKKCRLIIIEDYIILQPIDQIENESFYFKINEKINEKKLIKSPIKKIVKRSIKQQLIKEIDTNIYATYFNKEFKIVVKKSNKQEYDKRALTNGKLCNFYSRPELIEICKKLGVKLDSVLHKKEWYCKNLYKYMLENKLIVM